MNNRQRIKAALNYENYDRLPILHFGYWNETLDKWAAEGHITDDEAKTWGDGNDADKSISKKLGFDCNYSTGFSNNTDIFPTIETKVLETLPDGYRKVVNPYGVVVLERDGAMSIPAEVDHLLKGRKEWEEVFKPRLQFSLDRVKITPEIKSYVEDPDREEWYGIHIGSMFGKIRNWLGVEGSAYLYADDEDLFKEIIETVGDLTYQCAEYMLKNVNGFDFAHYWEDICFKNGPLIIPRVFDEYVGPQYKRTTDLLSSYGINIVSLDCDGMIDSLIPTWVNNGVNTMFPIEVGTWRASIAPWREKFGRAIKGVGGMDKVVFAFDYAAIDAEIERLKPLVELGGFIPCPDHRIAPDAKWENVQYYCDKMKEIFS